MELREDFLTLEIEEGMDLTEILGIKKWEKVIPANLAGKARGNFPSFIRKTDQERIQNLKKEIKNAFDTSEMFEITEKIDGSSMTVYYKSDADILFTEESQPLLGVCSRNLELKLDQEGNAFVDTAKSTGLLSALEKLGRNIAVQGELYGEGIQGNNEKIQGVRFAVFDIFDIDKYEYLRPKERYELFLELRELGANIEHVGVIGTNYALETDDVNFYLEWAEGKNSAGNEREGLVFKSNSRDFSFKAISNKFLLNEKD